jgi:lysozyme family protein
VVDLENLKAANLARGNAASVLPDLIPLVDRVSHRLVAAKQRYVTVALKTDVPWPVIAVIHERESSQSWAAAQFRWSPADSSNCRVRRSRPCITPRAN